MTEYTIVFRHRITWAELARLSNYNSLEAVSRLSSPGGLSLTFRRENLPIDVDIDTRLDIYRKRNGVAYRVGIYYVRVVKLKMDANKAETVSIFAEDTNALLARRIVAYHAGSPQASKEGHADDIMRAIVRENASLSAPIERRISSLLVERDTSEAGTIKSSFAWKKVPDALNSVAATALKKNSEKLFWQVVPSDGGDELLFIVRKGYVRDRRAGSGGGRAISQKMSIVHAAELAQDYSSAENFIYAGGIGTGEDRMLEEVYDSLQVDASRISRSEGFFDGANYDNATALSDAARVRLGERAGKTLFSAELAEGDNFIIGRDWNIGDAITVNAYGVHDMLIIGARFRSTQDNDAVDALLEEL